MGIQEYGDIDLRRLAEDLVAYICPYYEVLLHPFGKGKLTSDGVQYGAEHTTTTDNYEEVDRVTIEQSAEGVLEEIEFGLTAAIKSSGATEGVNYKWQASDDGTNWEDLCDEGTRAADASSYADVSHSGRFEPTGNFLGNRSSFQVRFVIKSAAAGGETATGKVKNSSYIKCKYRRS